MESTTRGIQTLFYSSIPSTDNQNNDMESSEKRSRSGWFIRIWVSVIASFIVALVLAALILIQGRVSGIEFSPTHLEQRSFHFFEIPVIEQQITPIRRKKVTNECLRFLRTGGFVKRAPTSVPRWDLVSITRGLSGTTHADAELLLSSLSTEREDVAYWKTWTEKNPTKAKHLWPIVQKLALNRLYLFIPPILEIAQNSDSEEGFQNGILVQIKLDYQRLADSFDRQNKPDVAEEIKNKASQLFPSIEWP